MTKRVLLGQLGSNGDCLYATTLARQIKADDPDCHLTWAIADICRAVADHNPHVDAVWEFPMGSWDRLSESWYAFEDAAIRCLKRGHFDAIHLTQIMPSNFANYDGTIRPSQFRNFNGDITVPVETVIELTESEQQKVDEFVTKNGIRNFDQLVIFECSSKSGQSFMTPILALEIAESVSSKMPGVCFVLSTHEQFESTKANIVHGGELSMRETAGLTHIADLFVGCGSGLTVVATSTAAKPFLPNIQILKKHSSVFASFKHDWAYFSKPTEHFLETTEENASRLADTILCSLKDGINLANEQFGETIEPTFKWYFELIDQMLVRKRRYVDTAQSLAITMERYGQRPDLKRFARSMVVPFLNLDEASNYPGGEQTIERLRNAMGKF